MNRLQRRAMKKRKVIKRTGLLKLDFGCGKRLREGFEGVDSIDFGQKYIVDLSKPWPWKDNSVEEANCQHMIEHLKPAARIHFVNELYRVLVPGGKCMLVAPHWASQRAYGDLTHEWPPVSEFWFYYLSSAWRKVNAPHNDGYTCNFSVTWGYALHPEVQARNAEYQQDMLKWNKEAAMDVVATFEKVEAA